MPAETALAARPERSILHHSPDQLAWRPPSRLQRYRRPVLPAVTAQVPQAAPHRGRHLPAPQQHQPGHQLRHDLGPQPPGRSPRLQIHRRSRRRLKGDRQAQAAREDGFGETLVRFAVEREPRLDPSGSYRTVCELVCMAGFAAGASSRGWPAVTAGCPRHRRPPSSWSPLGRLRNRGASVRTGEQGQGRSSVPGRSEAAKPPSR